MLDCQGQNDGPEPVEPDEAILMLLLLLSFFFFFFFFVFETGKDDSGVGDDSNGKF